jgi:hypothetical protein
VRGISKAIHELIYNPAKLNELSSRGIAQSGKYSWEISADRIVTAIGRVQK